MTTSARSTDHDDVRRVDAIDMLRGVAALGVATFHLYSQNLSPEWRETQPTAVNWLLMAGRWGVMLFFIVSGFVIALTLYDRRKFDRLTDVPLYFVRRVVRLDVLYLLVLGFYVLAGLTSPACTARDAIVAGKATLLPCPAGDGWSIAKNIFYFLPIERPLWVPVAWTLAIEVQFYLAMGALFVLLNKFSGMRFTSTILCVATLLSLASPLQIYRLEIGFWLYPSLFNLLGGCLVFLVVYRRTNFVLFACVLYILGLVVAFLSGREMHVLATLISWLAALGAVTLLPRFLTSNPVSLALGRYSYAIYLLHPLVGWLVVTPLTYSAIPLLSWGPAALLIGLFATIVLAALLHRVVEKPSIRWSKRIGR